MVGMYGQTQLVAFTLLRNDANLIESFVRHHCEQLASLVFLDDHSTDETVQILNQLKQEGLPVVILPRVDPPVTWEYELQLERVWAETPFDFVLPLQVTEYLVFNQNKGNVQKVCNGQSTIDAAIPTATLGFPSMIQLTPGVSRIVRLRPGRSLGLPLESMLIVDLPGFSVVDYRLKSCIYYLDWTARRRGEFCNITLWQTAFETLKCSSLGAFVEIPDRNAALGRLGIAAGTLRYPILRNTAETLPAEILEFCEHFALCYHERTLEKWPLLRQQNRLSAIENEIGILLRTRSWQCTRLLRDAKELMQTLLRGSMG